MKDFPPHVLRDYALIADGERGAVIGPRGDIVWMCPRRHCDALIGGEEIYAVTAAAEFVRGGYYEDGSGCGANVHLPQAPRPGHVEGCRDLPHGRPVIADSSPFSRSG